MQIEKLKETFKGDILEEGKMLDTYSKDASVFTMHPQVVVFPKDAEDVRTLVSFVKAEKEKGEEISIAPRAAGTDMTGGPLSDSIVMGTDKYLNHFEIKGQELLVEPGVYYRDFEKEGDAQKVMMPSYPASKSLAAFGGIINNNAGGEKTLRYGQTAKYVQEMDVVLADGSQITARPLNRDELEQKKAQQDFEGEVYRKTHELIEKNYDAIQAARPKVSKNAAGYFLWDVWNRDTGVFDLTKLFVGAQGTLGIMTRAKMKLVPQKPHTRLGVLFFKDLSLVPQMVNVIRPTEPDSLEVFDRATLWLALRFFPQIAKKAGENLFSFLLKFIPEALVGIRMLRMPALVMLVEYTGDTEEEVEGKLAEFGEKIAPYRIPNRVIHNPHDAEKYWIIRRESFSLLRKSVGKNIKATPFVDDFIVPPEELPVVLPKVYQILKEHGIKATLAGHAGSGNMHIIPLMNLAKDEEREKIFVVADKVYDLVLAHGGSITAEHNDGLIRGIYLEKMFGKDMYHLFEEVKQIFDPHGILNPGKKVGVSREKALALIDGRPKKVWG